MRFQLIIFCLASVAIASPLAQIPYSDTSEQQPETGYSQEWLLTENVEAEPEFPSENSINKDFPTGDIQTESQRSSTNDIDFNVYKITICCDISKPNDHLSRLTEPGDPCILCKFSSRLCLVLNGITDRWLDSPIFSTCSNTPYICKGQTIVSGPHLWFLFWGWEKN